VHRTCPGRASHRPRRRGMAPREPGPSGKKAGRSRASGPSPIPPDEEWVGAGQGSVRSRPPHPAPSLGTADENPSGGGTLSPSTPAFKVFEGTSMPTNIRALNAFRRIQCSLNLNLACMSKPPTSNSSAVIQLFRLFPPNNGAPQDQHICPSCFLRKTGPPPTPDKWPVI